MQPGTLISRYHARTALNKGGEVPPLHGLRAFFVFSVLFFHLWQQSWLTPTFSFPGRHVSLYNYLRTGYLFVDGMLLLSAFLLFLPFARARENNRLVPDFKGFYKKRFFRIVPTYVLHLLVVFLVVALPQRRYASALTAVMDWLAHLTFTHPLFAFSNIHTPLNGALWTLGVEVQFYLLFPFLARAYLKMPLLTWGSAFLLAFGFRLYAMSVPESPMFLNQLPAFLDVFLNGFVLAQIFARIENKAKDDGLFRVFMTAILVAAVIGLSVLIKNQAAIRDLPDIRKGQLYMRFTQSVLTGLILLGACFGLGGIRLLLGNKVTAWLSAISYQVYMWHQVIALQFKRWGFPPSVSKEPHMTGETSWQVSYVLLVLLFTLLISSGITYLIERPLSRRGTLKK